MVDKLDQIRIHMTVPIIQPLYCCCLSCACVQGQTERDRKSACLELINTLSLATILSLASLELINALSLDTILSASLPKIVQKVPPSLRSSLRACWSIPVRRIADHSDDEKAGILILFLLPRMIL